MDKLLSNAEKRCVHVGALRTMAHWRIFNIARATVLNDYLTDAQAAHSPRDAEDTYTEDKSEVIVLKRHPGRGTPGNPFHPYP